MSRSSLALNVAFPGAAGAPGARSAAEPDFDSGPGNPLRGPRIARFLAILATCGFVASAGWILAAGFSDRAPGDAATAVAPLSAGLERFAALERRHHPLPREWRTWGTAYDFERMYREPEPEQKRR